MNCGGKEISSLKKSEWMEEAYSILKMDERVAAIGWWNENWTDENGDVLMKINSSSKSQQTFANIMADEYFISEVEIENQKIVPFDGKCYNSAFLGIDPNQISQSELNQEVEAFENQSGKELSMVTCASIWTDETGGIHTPINAIQHIANAGKTPIMYIEPWSAYSYEITAPDPRYNMQSIIDGDWDSELTSMALEIKNLNIPIMAVFGHEANGQWFPWNGMWNGANETNGFGSPSQPDGPERFASAYRHIIDLFRNNDVQNVTWVLGMSFNTQPEEAWNSMANYYPGDDYIDWIGLSVYGSKNDKDENQFSFSFIWDYIQADLNAISTTKPIIILELGVGE